MEKLTLTEKERKALQNVIDACIDLHETSNGEIDCAEYGQESLTILRSIKEKLTKEKNA